MAAGGPIYCFSTYPVTAGNLFPVFLTAEMPEGLGWVASLPADSTWRLFFRAPMVLPSGTTAKLLMACHANATTGNAVIEVAWKSYGANEVPASADLTGEGDDTITFATTAYRETQVKRTLDADTIVAGELIMMELRGKTTGSVWTLAANLAMQRPAIIWE